MNGEYWERRPQSLSVPLDMGTLGPFVTGDTLSQPF